MCGILGIFGELTDISTSYSQMLQTLKHRGPDDKGFIKGKIENNDFFLSHQRLSIIVTVRA